MGNNHELAGLHQPGFENDCCGFGLITKTDDKPNHWLVQMSNRALTRLVTMQRHNY